MKAEEKKPGEIYPGVVTVEHTADVGIHVTASSMDQLFEKSALGMVALMAGKVGPCPGVKTVNKKMMIEGMDREELINNFLSELLYLLEGEGLILTGFESCYFEDGMLFCQGVFQDVNESCRKISTPIKAVTFHKLKVQKVKGTHQVTIIFDV